MPVCRHCGSRISKFDKDRCPICGEVSPLNGVSSDTVEITSQIHLGSGDYSDFKPKRRKIFILLGCLFGYLGLQFFYIGRGKVGLIWFLANLLVGAGLFFLVLSLSSLIWLSILITAVVMYAISIGSTLYLNSKPNLQDGKGNLVR